MNTCCQDSSEYACKLTSPELAARKDQIARTLGQGATRITESSTHVILEFDRADDWLAEIADFIRFEQQCCPFLAYRIEIPANQESLEFSIGGSAEAKRFLIDELGDALSITGVHTT